MDQVLTVKSLHINALSTGSGCLRTPALPLIAALSVALVATLPTRGIASPDLQLAHTTQAAAPVTTSTGGPGQHKHHHPASAHVHGQGHMVMAMQALPSGGASLDVRIELPAEALFGFEHAPRTDAHRQTVRQALDKLKLSGQLIKLAPAACQAASEPVVELPWAMTTNTRDAANTASSATTANATSHTDVIISQHLSCVQRPAQAQIELFAAFHRLKQLTATVIDTSGQRSVRLTPQAAVLRFSR